MDNRRINATELISMQHQAETASSWLFLMTSAKAIFKGVPSKLQPCFLFLSTFSYLWVEFEAVSE